MYPLLQIQQQQKNLKNWGQKSFLGNSFYRISVHSECWKFKEVSSYFIFQLLILELFQNIYRIHLP